MVFRSRVLQSLATPSHSMHMSARAARIQMRAGGVRGFAAWSTGRCPVVGESDAAVIGEVVVVASRLRAGSRAITMPAAPATPSVVAGPTPAPPAPAPTQAPPTPPPQRTPPEAAHHGRA